MKKIVHIQVIPQLSGVQLFSVSLLGALSDHEYEKYIIFSSSEIISNEKKHEIINICREKNIHIIWMSNLFRQICLSDFFCFFKFIFLFRKYNFDIVHTNSTKPGIIARVAAAFAGVKKIIHTVHGISYTIEKKFLKKYFFYLIEILCVPFCDYNVCVNKYYIKYYRWIPFVKHITIYNGFDYSKLGPVISKNRVDFTGQVINLLYVGRLDNQKDPITLLEVMNYLKEGQSGYKFHLDIVGDGALYSDCISFSQKNELEKYVTFWGWSSDVSKFYKKADIFLCSSIYEAFGFIFLESAYEYIPIIATNVEGIPEVVMDNKMGFLVEPKNPEQFVEKILFLVKNPDLYIKFAQFAHDSVIHRFSLDDMISKYDEIYKS